MRLHRDRAVLITDAERSQEDQLRTRTVRYVTLMLLRLVSLLVAAAVVVTKPPLWGLWLVLCAVGMIIVPWVAVVLANDRLPKEQHRWRGHRHEQPPAKVLPAPPPADRAVDSDEGPER